MFNYVFVSGEVLTEPKIKRYDTKLQSIDY